MVLQVVNNCLPSGLKSQLSAIGPVASQSLSCCGSWGSSPRCFFHQVKLSRPGLAQGASRGGQATNCRLDHQQRQARSVILLQINMSAQVRPEGSRQQCPLAYRLQQRRTAWLSEAYSFLSFATVICFIFLVLSR